MRCGDRRHPTGHGRRSSPATGPPSSAATTTTRWPTPCGDGSPEISRRRRPRRRATPTWWWSPGCGWAPSSWGPRRRSARGCRTWRCCPGPTPPRRGPSDDRAASTSCGEAAAVDDRCCEREVPPSRKAKVRRRAGPPRRLAGPPRSTPPWSSGTASTTRGAASTGRLVDHLGADAVWLVDPPPRRRGRVELGDASASDTGGTFTDLVTADGRVAKVPSTPGTTRARRCGQGGRSAARGRAAPAVAAGPRHDGGHQRPARAPGRDGGAGHHRGLRRRHRDRPPGPTVALRPVGRPARAAGAPRAAARGGGAARPPTARARAARPDVPARCPTAWRPWRCACCTPTSSPATSGWSAPSSRAGATTSACSCDVSAPSSGSTSARSPRSSTPTCARCAAPTCAASATSPTRSW